jgi:putative transposase
MQFRGYTYALRPTDEQSVLFDQFAGVCRLVWNLALDQRLNHWRNFQATTGDNLNYVTQARELTKLRAEVDFVRAVPQQSQQRTLKALDEAFRRAWQGRGGYPQFKRKGVNDAFSFAGRNIRVEKINRRWSRVKLPKVGWVKFRDTRTVRGSIAEVTVTRAALGWQVSIGCKLPDDAPVLPGCVGIDRGVTVPLMLSDGTSYALPSSVEIFGRRIRKAQRIASRRKRGSIRHAKANRRVAKLKARQARIRKHWAHTATTDICRRYGTVVVERLRTTNMTASAAGTVETPGKNVAQKRGLNRAILNVGWHRIETMLAYKAGNLIKVNPAYSSQTCGSCGATDSRSRKNQATFVCTACGHRDNADRNAAVVILNRGNAPGVEPCHRAGVEARTIHGNALEIPAL